jgi:hypothetical protein
MGKKCENSQMSLASFENGSSDIVANTFDFKGTVYDLTIYCQ